MKPLLTLLLFAAAAIGACSDPPPLAAPVPRAAATANLSLHTVVRETVARETRFDGVVEAVSRSTVAAQTSGRVMALPFDVGDYVPPGADIVRLTSKEQGASVDAAESALAEARARLAEAQASYRRAQDVYAQQLIAKAEFDRVAANHRAARARLDSAQAQLERAREALDYTVVKAPYGGMVLERHVHLGETVAPGTPLMTGLSLEQLRVIVHVPQQHIDPLRTHERARILLRGASLAVDDFRIPPAADPATHSFRVRIDLPAGIEDVYPGTLVKVAFVSGESRPLLLPPAALVRRGELTGAYVLEDNRRISLRQLRVGSPLPDGRLPVASGLAEGERVITDPIAAAIAYKEQFAAGDAS